MNTSLRFHGLSLCIVALCASACTGSAGSNRTTTAVAPPHAIRDDRAATPDSGATPVDPALAADRRSVAAMNARARAAATTDTMHGVQIEDPYRLLETDSPATQEWIQGQTTRAQAFVTAHTRPGMRERLDALHRIGTLGAPEVAGHRVVYTRRVGDREQPVLMVAELRDGQRRGEARELLDPTRVVWPSTGANDPGGTNTRTALDWFVISPRGTYVAIGLSRNGDERSTLDVIELATGRRVGLRIAHTKWCRFAWLPDESGFFYTRYPRPGEDGYSAEQEDTYNPRLFFHDLRASRAALRTGPGPAALGTNDPLIFREAVRTDAMSSSVSDDGRWVVVQHFRGWTRQDLFLIDRRARVAPGARPEARQIIQGRDNLSWGFVRNGTLYVVTNVGAPRKRVIAAPVEAIYRAAAPRADEPAPQAGSTATATATATATTTTTATATTTASTTAADPFALAPAGPWRVVIAQGEHPITSVVSTASRLLVHTNENISSRLRVHLFDGRAEGEIALPGTGTVEGYAADERTDDVAFTYSSFFEAPVLLSAVLPHAGTAGASPSTSPASFAAHVIDQVPTDFDASRYVLERANVPSRDGTPINVFYMHRRDMPRDGSNPTLLYGYGGFNVALMPRFARHPLYWLERGGVYAVANLRGGSEFGEEWHRAGALLNKNHVYEDFEAAIRWLATSGISRVDRIGLHGASNGGLLMGAMLTRVPETFHAAFSEVGLYDMVRFHRFPPAAIWTSEYGTPDNAEHFRVLHGYSPYHRLRPATRYPAAWIETADHDSRVYWGHSTKFAARLQDAQGGDDPVYFFMRRNVGHGAGMQRSDLVDRYVRMYAFFEHELGVSR